LQGFNTGDITLGTLILWLGWLFFNAGSTLEIVGLTMTAERAMTNTLICPASAGLTAFFFKKYITCDRSVKYDLGALCNGILAGLVTITAGCDNFEPWVTFLVGILGGLVYCLSCASLGWCKIDDPLEAFPIHGACGIWGCLMVAFCHRDVGIFYGHDPKILGWQIAGIVTIMAWSGGMTFIIWFTGKKLGIVRAPDYEEILGLDYVKHNGTLNSDEIFHL